ncbi:hypothetical protein BSK50_30235 [Paenibacillus odorifer]|nr:hypothetical protein BSK50_30235 [Paenibacillus odorifer]
MYNVLRIKIKRIIEDDYNVTMDIGSFDKEEKKEHIVKQQHMTMFQQIELINQIKTLDIDDLIIVQAKRSKSQEAKLKKLIKKGFTFNGLKYVRFGKSSSQAKDGITIFIKESIFDQALERTQLGVPIDTCIVSKYEAYRNLVFTACTPVIEDKLPYIVIVDEYEKILPDQHVRYVTQEKREFYSEEDGVFVPYDKRICNEGLRNVKISPFDGFGIHTKEMSKIFSKHLNLKFTTSAVQIRLPYLKGMSVEAPFKEFYRKKNITKIKDVYGRWHDIEKIDCIWNTTMFKAHGIFFERYKDNAWEVYLSKVVKYGYQLGISKYTKNKKYADKYARMNFQYLQCLDLWNPEYIKKFNNKDNTYNILESNGKIVELARYTTKLYENIILGSKFHTVKFLGVADSDGYTTKNNYIKAIMINESMIKDPAIRSTLKRLMHKAITEAKRGKIYSKGFYHILVGDIVGYMEYCVGLPVVGCLNAGEFHAKTMPLGKLASFRSPLVDPSEVNIVNNVRNEDTENLFGHFKDQDLVMINMYDLTLPQQGGADQDGDAVMLCYDKMIIDSKINKPIVVDETDKQTAKPMKYNQKNIVEYELNSRDDRIGEITNVATSILNQYYTNPDDISKAEDDISLLRLYQGKECDFIKTGYRWNLTSDFRKKLKRLPYFLSYKYEDKQKRNREVKKLNKLRREENDLNKDNKDYAPSEMMGSDFYPSPSPMNELCDYIEKWEQKVKWNNDYFDNKHLVINHDLSTDNKLVIKEIKKIFNSFKNEFKKALEEEKRGKELDYVFDKYKEKINELKTRFIDLSKKELVNYCIFTAYNIGEDKTLCWSLFGETILENLERNTPVKKRYVIEQLGEQEEGSYEFLGNYYSFQEFEDGVFSIEGIKETE